MVKKKKNRQRYAKNKGYTGNKNKQVNSQNKSKPKDSKTTDLNEKVLITSKKPEPIMAEYRVSDEKKKDLKPEPLKIDKDKFDTLSQEEQLKAIEEGSYTEKVNTFTKEFEQEQKEVLAKVEKEIVEKKNSKKRKWLRGGLVVGGMITVIALSGLMGYGYSQSQIKNPVEAKNTSIEYNDLSKLFLSNDQIKVLLQQKIVGDIFEKNHSNLVKDSDVETEIARIKKEYGDSYKEILKSSGFDEESFETYTRQSLIMKKFVENSVKIEEKDLKEAFENYIPTQKVVVGVFGSKEEAEAYKKDSGNSKYENNIQELELGTSSNERGLSNQILEASYKTKQGEFSSILEEKSTSDNSTVYVVVKVIKHNEKGSIEDEKEGLKKTLVASKTTDIEYSSKVIKKELDNLGVKYNDKNIETAVKEAFDTQINPSK